MTRHSPITEPLASSEISGRITYRRFLEMDLENPHAEWVDGEVIDMPPVSNLNATLSAFLMGLLQFFVDAKDLGELKQDPFQMKTGPDLPGRAPDILFVSKSNLGRLKKNHLEGPADLVIEITSPGSRATDRREKHREYELGGVREYWLLDPERKQAEFYILGRDGIYSPITIGHDRIFCSTVLDAFWIEVDWLWTRPPVPSIIKMWKLL